MKYDSVYYNSERYYDSTAGAAILNIIREEKKKKYVIPAKRAIDDAEIFVDKFCAHYKDTHPPRANGKPLRYTVPSIVKKQIRLYEFCMEHCEKDWFTIDAAVERFGLGSQKKVEQCFSGRGDIGKLISCWNSYKATGAFRWSGRET